MAPHTARIRRILDAAASALAERVQDEKSLEHVAEAFEQMQKAVDALASARTEPAREPLTPALAAEQAAYQALLKLRAREHEVVRQQQRRDGGSEPGAHHPAHSRSA